MIIRHLLYLGAVIAALSTHATADIKITDTNYNLGKKNILRWDLSAQHIAYQEAGNVLTISSPITMQVRLKDLNIYRDLSTATEATIDMHPNITAAYCHPIMQSIIDAADREDSVL